MFLIYRIKYYLRYCEIKIGKLKVKLKLVHYYLQLQYTRVS